MPQLQGNNPVNDPDSKPVKNRSQFKPNSSLYQTMKFGLNQPHFVMEVVEGDKISVRVTSDLDTFSLKAPVMTPVRMHKEYFFTPLRAILPKNADLLITNPLSGDDINPRYVNAVVPRSRFSSTVATMVTHFNTAMANAAAASSTRDADMINLAHLIYMVQIMEPILSDGSLLCELGHPLSSTVHFGSKANYETFNLDEVIDAFVRRISEDVQEFTVTFSDLVVSGTQQPTMGAQTKVIVVNTDLNSELADATTWSMRQFLSELRQGRYVLKVSIPSTGGMRSTYDTSHREVRYQFDDSQTNAFSAQNGWPSSISSGEYVSLLRLVAYQLACAQFYTDDAVDYIYSTALWHENMLGLYNYWRAGTFTYPAAMFYPYNGISKQYDSVSGYLIDTCLNSLSDFNLAPTVSSGEVFVYYNAAYNNTNHYKRMCGLGYYTNLFGHTRSLKYRDYFVGSRPHPLAVGGVDVSVSGGSFSVVDVTKNIQIQRFLNQVNRTGRRFKEYVQGIFGVTPMADPHDVIFLGQTTDVIGAEETENTGAAQLTEAQTVTSKLRMNSSRFAFEGSFSEPGIVIGITNFDVIRPYLDATPRTLLHVDRYDMFNPFMQQIGDQPVEGYELHPRAASNDDFSYKLRYSEYKQAFDRAVGGFRRFLPGYAFLNDQGFYARSEHISPEFIRSHETEFDRFYIALVGYSAASYFHFIFRNDAEVQASRPMEAAPSIL